ncbi:MAG: hypothetical protein M3171_14740, partial [Actinomycetota bacterium]|nr:hypothetical protein [Actinomycetota bacterium]
MDEVGQRLGYLRHQGVPGAHLSPVMGALTLLLMAAAFHGGSRRTSRRNERRWGSRTLVGTAYLTLAARRPTGTA